MSTTPVVEFRRVSYRIREHDILRDIDLEVASGETVVLLGRSGSGKTTLLKTVNALIRPSEGEIRVEGHSVSSRDPIPLRRRIGYVIQDTGLFPHFTVKKNIGLIPELLGWPPDRIDQRTSTLLDAVALPQSYASRYPRELSGGEKQRVGIARALAADPPLLLLDEPFAALDPVTRFELQQLFLSLRREFAKSALFVTHDIREALMMASRIALLHQGRIDVIAPPDEFRRATTPEAAAFLSTLETP